MDRSSTLSAGGATLDHGTDWRNMKKRVAVVLVVEDSAVIRMGAVDLVVSAGFEALEASSADEAIATLEALPDIHLVFTDVEMPARWTASSSPTTSGTAGHL